MDPRLREDDELQAVPFGPQALFKGELILLRLRTVKFNQAIITVIQRINLGLINAS